MSIPKIVEAVLKTHTFNAKPKLSDVIALDAWARQEANNVITTLEKKQHVL